MKRPPVSPELYFVIPVLNEEACLPLVLDGMRQRGIDLSRVVIVDNGSTDRSAEIARQQGADVLSEPQRGYGAACLCGIDRVRERATASGAYDRTVVVFIDGDFSDDLDDLGPVLGPILSGDADLVVGSRLRLPEARESVPLPSRVGNAIAGTYIRLRYGVSFTDLGPFRAIRLGTLDALGVRDRTWGWTVEMQIRAAASRVPVAEVPVSYRKRAGGRSKISGTITGSARAAVKILSVIARSAVTIR